MSLKGKTLTGFFWSLSQQFGTQIFTTIVTIVLARILEPKDFGLIGMLTVFIAIGNSLVDAGLTSSLIRTKDADQRDFSTVFYINLVGSILVYGLLFVSAPWISRFFSQPVLEDIVRVYSISFIFNAFSAVQRTRLVKKMDFKTELKVTLPSVVVAGILGIVLANIGFSVWSLVIMAVTQQFLISVQFWLYSKWRPSFIFDFDRFKYHFDFGYKITLSSLLNAVFSNIYNLVIGKYFTVSQLGFYAKADSLKQLPVRNISTALNKVTYPMFSEIQGDKVKMKKTYKRVMQQVLFWLTPVMVLAAILAEPTFRFVLTEKWLPAVPYFQLLCFIGLMFPIHSYNINVLKVKGRSDLVLRLEIIKKSLTALGVILALPYGIFALIWTQIGLNIISFGINSYYSGKFIDYGLFSQFKDIIPIFFFGALAGMVTWVGSNMFVSELSHDLLKILIGGSMGMVAYLLISWLSKSEPLSDFKQIILKK